MIFEDKDHKHNIIRCNSELRQFLEAEGKFIFEEYAPCKLEMQYEYKPQTLMRIMKRVLEQSKDKCVNLCGPK